MQKNKTIMFVIGIIVVGVAAFYGGLTYGKTQAKPSMALGRGAGAGFRNAQANGGGVGNGDVMAKDDKSVTIKLKNGGSQIIFYSDATDIMKSVKGTSSDINVGQTVIATGKTNSDGSLTAQVIQIRPSSTPAIGGNGGNGNNSGNNTPGGAQGGANTPRGN